MNDYRGVISARQYGDSYLVLKVSAVSARARFSHGLNRETCGARAVLFRRKERKDR